MTARLNPYTISPQVLQPLHDFSQAVIKMGLEPSLISLVEIRASQLNGCAICLHMHTRDARKAGETEERIYLLDSWRETPLYSPRERAALAWTEALTRLSETHAPDADYELLKAEFAEEEQLKLTMMINVINSWNRLGVGFRASPPVSAGRAAA